MIRICIVEDDADSMETLVGYATKFSTENGIAVSVKCFSDAVNFLTEYKSDFDVVFLDIEMPMMDGMSAAKRLRAIDPYVIIVFVTNMQQYAIKGYSVGALDFVIKPVRYFGFSTLMKKIVRAIAAKPTDMIRITEIGTGSVKQFPVSAIKYVEVSSHKLTYHTEDGNFRVWGNLCDVEKILPADAFSKCNSCYLVSLRHVVSVDGEDITVSDSCEKEVLKMSRLRKKDFLSALAGYLGRRN